jgi:light-regulated signal transduction histidine kinase (bacteriophytochrome)
MVTEFTLAPLLDACEKEPLANSGQIQNAGVLIHVDRASGLISFASDNTASWLGDAPAELVGSDGRTWIREFLPDVIDLPAAAGSRLLLKRALDLGFGELDVLISATATGWLIELEPYFEPSVDPSAIQLSPVPELIDTAALLAAQQDLVDRIAQATGYDRAMLYEFKTDWSGEVLAERVTGSAVTYLGLRFPASDIPAIARALYAQTPYRHIPDAACEPIAILGASGQGAALDLTWSDLRSVSPVHRQYLRNMQVAASFSVSVMVEGKLWGLVACHHPKSLTVPVATRIRCQELVLQFVSTLTAYRRQIQTAQLASLEGALAPVVEASSAGTSIIEPLQACLADISRVLDAESGAMVLDDQLAQTGGGAAPELIRQVHDWSVAHQSASVAAFEHLPEGMRSPSQASSAGVCGLLSISVRARRHGNRLVGFYFFRPEEPLEIAWAGNPEKAMDTADGSVRLSPRHSFDKWVVVRSGFSRPWDPLVMFTATQLQRRLQAIL